jgi:hypothetical protein
MAAFDYRQAAFYPASICPIALPCTASCVGGYGYKF